MAIVNRNSLLGFGSVGVGPDGGVSGPVSAKEIPQMMELLFKRIESLTNTVGMLSSSLTPVIRDHDGDEEIGKDKKFFSSPLARNLQDMELKLESIECNVQYLINTIEL